MTVGDILDFGGHPHAVCPDCRKLVRLDKPIVGALHVCLSEEERAAKYASDLLYSINPGNPNRRL